MAGTTPISSAGSTTRSAGATVAASSPGTIGNSAASSATNQQKLATLDSTLTQVLYPNIPGGITDAGIANDVATALQNSGQFTSGEIAALTQTFDYINNGSPGFRQQGSNPALFVQAWYNWGSNALAAYWAEQPATTLTPPDTTSTPTPTPPSDTTRTTQPVARANPDSGITVPTNPTTPLTPPPDDATTTTPTTPTSPTTPTTPATPDWQNILSWLSGLGGATGSGAGGTTGPGDLPDTSTPISSLGALTPIGTPTSTASSTTGSSTIVLVVAGLAAVGGGIFLWERHKKKKQQQQGGVP